MPPIIISRHEDIEEKDEPEEFKHGDEVARIIEGSYVLDNTYKTELARLERNHIAEIHEKDIFTPRMKDQIDDNYILRNYPPKENFEEKAMKTALEKTEEHLKQHYPDYTLEKDYSDTRRIVAVNKKDKHIAIGFRGTQPTDKSDLEADLEIMIGRHLRDPTPQEFISQNLRGGIKWGMLYFINSQLENWSGDKKKLIQEVDDELNRFEDKVKSVQSGTILGLRLDEADTAGLQKDIEESADRIRKMLVDRKLIKAEDIEDYLPENLYQAPRRLGLRPINKMRTKEIMESGTLGGEWSDVDLGRSPSRRFSGSSINREDIRHGTELIDRPNKWKRELDEIVGRTNKEFKSFDSLVGTFHKLGAVGFMAMESMFLRHPINWTLQSIGDRYGGVLKNYEYEGLFGEGLKMGFIARDKEKGELNRRFEDNRNLHDALERKYPDYKIIPLGHSLGSIFSNRLAKDRKLRGIHINSGGFATDITQMKDNPVEQTHLVSTHSQTGTKDPLGAIWGQLQGKIITKSAKPSMLSYLPQTISTIGSGVLVSQMVKTAMTSHGYIPLIALSLGGMAGGLVGITPAITKGLETMETHGLHNWYDDENKNKAKTSTLKDWAGQRNEVKNSDTLISAPKPAISQFGVATKHKVIPQIPKIYAKTPEIEKTGYEPNTEVVDKAPTQYIRRTEQIGDLPIHLFKIGSNDLDKIYHYYIDEFGKIKKYARKHKRRKFQRRSQNGV